ncbi:MAG: aminotransferase class IV [Flavobacterium sp.]
MINFNGFLQDADSNLLAQNRGFLYGDGVFETLKVVSGKILFFEDHYFRLMAAMRIVRMQIPMHFTQEYLEEQVALLVQSLNCALSARVRISIYRNDGGFYLPSDNEVSFLMQASQLQNQLYCLDEKEYEVDLYKDFYISKQLLSTLKTTNKMIHITGSIFANENDLDNCLLLNESKNVVEALQGNLFMRMGNKLITPPLSEGCLNGIMRKQILELAKKESSFEVVETTISPFDLQKADELFITNVIKGIQPITKYRKKEFGTATADHLITLLNKKIQI